MGEWTKYFEDLLQLDQERFELEILLFFEDCNYDWHEIDVRIGHLPPDLQRRVSQRVEVMRDNTIMKMSSNLNALFVISVVAVMLVSLFIGFIFGWVVAVHFGAIALIGLTLLAMAGALWIRRK